MGKGKGKAGRKEAKLIVKKLNQEPKIPGLPKPARPEKKAKKIPSREKKSAMHSNPPGPANFPLPMGRPKPFTKSPQHAKWPAMFKKHLGVIEAHIRSLDRVMQSMKSEMTDLPEKERLEFELGERGNWRVICGMMDRAREVLTSARIAARGIVPSRHLQDKKGLGVLGTNFEPLGPKLEQKAAEIGFDPVGKGKLGRNPEDVDEDGDSEMTDDSDDSSEAEGSDKDGVADNSDFVKLDVGSKIPRFESLANDNKAAVQDTTSTVESNPYFVVDVEPTPVNIGGPEPEKKSRKQQKAEALEARKAARLAKKLAHEAAKLAPPKEPTPQPEAAPEPQPEPQPEPDFDYAELEANLQAEIAAGTKAQEEAEEKKSKKKRRRSSGVDEDVVEKKAKVEKKEKKRKAEAEENGGSVDAADVKKVKKEKKEKKEKKRKAEESADTEEAEEGTKKKRRHKDHA
ncbi:uncharacterized protein RAG0_13977 [Rhynchosporium agropyri]|uniref:Uncharacterized protein n=1 Tax=Rhynchosporium agropyri TaxID=914238 RepID=A0A1E1LF08_9HELO|nr:uncharacterized protein RAG0_13977 [Rhynchosporium agropyri]